MTRASLIHTYIYIYTYIKDVKREKKGKEKKRESSLDRAAAGAEFRCGRAVDTFPHDLRHRHSDAQ